MASGLALSSSAMAGTEFKPEGQTFWVKRSELLARIAGDGTTQLAGDAILENMKTSCDGLHEEQRSHELGKVPMWAATAQNFACSAFDRWSSGPGGFLKTKVPCADVRRSIDTLDKMRAADEAPEVVTATTNLKNTLQALLDSAKTSGSLRCRY